MKGLMTIVFLFFFISVKAQSNPSESDYSIYIQSLIGGEREVFIKNGRIDLLTSTHAIEIERASKWKESIGQSIWYALNTNKKPGIILLVIEPKDRKYLIQLITALEYANLNEQIDVYSFPEDFEELINGRK